MMTLALLAVLQDLNLAQLELERSALGATPAPAAAVELNSKVTRLIESNVLDSGEEFSRVVRLLTPITNEYEEVRVRYELLYTATALGVSIAPSLLATEWDNLTMSLEHHRTIGIIKMEKGAALPLTTIPQVSPKAILKVLTADRLVKVTIADNPEIKKLFDEDQAARSFDFSKVTQKQIEEMVKGDAKRMARIRTLLTGGKVRSANDFYYSAFLYQHGTCFEEYHIAHELSLCSLLLGNPQAKWIGAASYDRMLRSGGHAQRWGTQYVSPGFTGLALAKTDSAGLSDRQRKAVIGLTLDEAKNRVLK